MRLQSSLQWRHRETLGVSCRKTSTTKQSAHARLRQFSSLPEPSPSTAVSPHTRPSNSCSSSSPRRGHRRASSSARCAFPTTATGAALRTSMPLSKRCCPGRGRRPHHRHEQLPPAIVISGQGHVQLFVQEDAVGVSPC